MLNSPSDETSCKVFVDEVYDPSTEEHVTIAFFIIYSFQFVMGFIGNTAVLFLTLRNQRLQTVQNLFMVNLAVADLVVCLFSLPITPITNIYKNWYFGEKMCYSLSWIQGTSVLIAAFSLCTIAVDRYCMIVKPHWKRLSRENARYVMLFLWFLSAIVTLPYSWYMKVIEYEGLCGTFCTEEWPDDKLRRSYTIFVLCTQFFVPFSIMFFCYYKIFAQLTKRTRAKLKKLNDRSLILAASMPIMSTMIKRIPNQSQEVEQCRRKCELLAQTRKNTLVLVSMVVVFGVSCFPHNAASVALEFTDGNIFLSEDGLKDYSYLISLVTHSISMMNCVANPILYGLLNPSFVEIFRKTCADFKDSFHRLKRMETVTSNSTMV
ncbi:unnamed protein product [Auanema sp. JU1783]|nr:unnamed protein product [Auanema sp. JU1783]